MSSLEEEEEEEETISDYMRTFRPFQPKPTTMYPNLQPNADLWPIKVARMDEDLNAMMETSMSPYCLHTRFEGIDLPAREFILQYFKDFADRRILVRFSRLNQPNNNDGNGGNVSNVSVKLLKFQEDHRPPFCGTLNDVYKPKLSRKTWIMDRATGILDYEYDSEADWVDEEEGEELLSEDELDEDNEEPMKKKAMSYANGDITINGQDWNSDDDDEDGDFLVPHGYLSNDEGVDSGSDKESDCERQENVQEDLVLSTHAESMKKVSLYCKFRSCEDNL